MLDDRPYMREPAYGSRWSVSVVLVVINAAVFAIQLVAGLAAQGRGFSFIETYLALIPADLARGWIWQLITFQFLHAGPLHLILNCAMLYLMGRPVEIAVGPQRLLWLFLGSGAVGGLLQAACSWVLPGHFGAGPVMGASAGVFGITAAFAVLNWETPITTLVAFIIPVTMRAKYLVLVMAIIGLLGVLDRRSGIAHAAHLGGLVAGLLGTRRLAGLPLVGWQRRPERGQPAELVAARAERKSLWKRAEKADVEELPPDEFISREVDPILDKIAAHGMHSLTEREKKILERARAKMSRR